MRIKSYCFRKGSITAEAAIAFPIFFMIVVCIVSIMNIYGTAVGKMSAMRDIVEAAASAADVSEDALWIDITVPEYFKPFFLPDGLTGTFIKARGRVRAWNGRSDDEKEAASDTDERYVYVTENGSVYHTSSTCTHIELSTRSVWIYEVPGMRNTDGSKYKPCEKCCRHGSGSMVYITDDGDRYHSSFDCPGLKRTVRLVPESSVEGKCECERCAAARAG